jgi:acyl-CoA synthetase (AMP-forming)/AMP-acid ligase II
VFFELYEEPTTYGGLRAAARRYGAALAAAGVGPGDRVVVLLPTCKEFFATLFGTMALGAVPVPLYPTFGAAELGSIIAHAEPRVAVTISWFEATVRQACGSWSRTSWPAPRPSLRGRP